MDFVIEFTEWFQLRQSSNRMFIKYKINQSASFPPTISPIHGTSTCRFHELLITRFLNFKLKYAIINDAHFNILESDREFVRVGCTNNVSLNKKTLGGQVSDRLSSWADSKFRITQSPIVFCNLTKLFSIFYLLNNWKLHHKWTFWNNKLDNTLYWNPMLFGIIVHDVSSSECPLIFPFIYEKHSDYWTTHWMLSRACNT